MGLSQYFPLIYISLADLLKYPTSSFFFFFSFLGWGEAESTWYVGQ
jgi:hypothetical protein